MSTKFKNLKNELEDIEEGQFALRDVSSSETGSSSSKISSYVLFFAFLISLLFYAGTKINFSFNDLNPIDNIVQELNQPDEDLLNRMGAWMTEMGYGELTQEELIGLRNEGVTATYTSQIRDVGYTDVSLEQLIALQNADVSATFARMMKELGYDLSVQDLVELRNNNVTAFFTSNMMDLGYTMEELTKENLMRMRSIGVTHQLAERRMNETGIKQSVDELIRHIISNQ